MYFLLVLSLITISIAFGGPVPVPPKFGYVPNTPENIALLKSENYKQNPEELSGQFEGDIVLNKEQAEYIFGDQRNGLIDKRYRWPNNIVPYNLSEVFSPAQVAHIELGLKTLESISCIKFVPHTNQVAYIHVTGLNTGCHSHVGKQGARQQLNLQLSAPNSGCFRLGTIMHEFLHALGFYHMQSATDRDDFVKIEWNNIQAGTENNFAKHDANRITNFGIVYDVTSVLHYSAYAFSSNGYATIVPNDISLIDILGQRAQLTDADIKKLNVMYDCKN